METKTANRTRREITDTNNSYHSMHLNDHLAEQNITSFRMLAFMDFAASGYALYLSVVGQSTLRPRHCSRKKPKQATMNCSSIIAGGSSVATSNCVDICLPFHSEKFLLRDPKATHICIVYPAPCATLEPTMKIFSWKTSGQGLVYQATLARLSYIGWNNAMEISPKHMTHFTLFSLLWVPIIDPRPWKVPMRLKIWKISMSKVYGIREDPKLGPVIFKNSSMSSALVFDTPEYVAHTLDMSEDKTPKLGKI